jgi:adenylate cyclase
MMRLAMRRSTRRRLVAYLGILGACTVVGAAYGTIAAFVHSGDAWPGAGVGAIRGLTLSAIIAGLELFGMRTRPGRLVERAPLAVTVGIKTLVYGSTIVAIEAIDLGGRLAHGEADQYPGLFPSRMAAMSIAFALSASLFVLLMIEVARLLGPGRLFALVCGRYHRPRTEERFFLFVDVAGSTALAERLGAEAVHRFLDRVFRVSADAIDDYLGDVYQYVGDEMVVTWTAACGQAHGRPLACFFAIEAALASTAFEFVRDFGVMPRVRGRSAPVHVFAVDATAELV